MAGNKRIPELPPNAALQPNYKVAVYNVDNDTTERVDVSELNSTSSGDFRWLSSPESYDTGEVVTYLGEWYQSLVDDNEGIIPGTDEDSWEPISKSASGKPWVAGVYVDTFTMVFSDHNGQLQQFNLASAVRPYVSVNIANEELAGDWVSITEVLQNVEVDLSVAEPDLNFRRHRDKIFTGSTPISTPKIFLPVQDLNAKRFTLIIDIENVAATLEWPENFFSHSALWDSVGKLVTFIIEGRYKLKGTFDGNDWLLEIESEIYV